MDPRTPRRVKARRERHLREQEARPLRSWPCGCQEVLIRGWEWSKGARKAGATWVSRARLVCRRHEEEEWPR